MATKNPRVVGYVQPETHAKLKQFMKECNVSESKALDLILGEYFGVEVPRVAPSSTLDIDSKINEAIAPLQSQLDELRAALTVRRCSPEDTSGGVIPARLTQGQLADRLGVARETIGRHNDRGDLQGWSRRVDPDGVGWRHQPDRDAFPSKIFVPINEAKQGSAE